MLNPKKNSGNSKIEIYKTKRIRKIKVVTERNLEREVREYLCRKVSGSYLGLWLLIPEYLRMGSWDLLKLWNNNKKDCDINSRIALQAINESALCVNRQRPARSLAHQGFEILNGLPFLASDVSIHNLLNEHTINDSIKLQINLAKLRLAKGDYSSKGLLAFDPHRINTYTRRIMPAKKKDRTSRSKKILQAFFCIDAITGQPISFVIGSSSATASKSTLELLTMIKSVFPENIPLIAMADSEHATSVIINEFTNDKQLNIIMPFPLRGKAKELVNTVNYQRQWAGYAIGETNHRMEGVNSPIRLAIQRTGEIDTQYTYKTFLITGEIDKLRLISEDYPERWKIEEFFNFESAMGWNRASTMNLNIRYGRMSLALIAQAATYQIRKKLSKPYKTWTAEHLSDSLFKGIEGDLRVKDDRIIVTYYNFPENLNIKSYYENLPEKLISEGVDPRIPWLYNFKVDFRFK